MVSSPLNGREEHTGCKQGLWSLRSRFQCWLGQITLFSYAPCFLICKFGVFIVFTCEWWWGLNGYRSPVGTGSVSFSQLSYWLHSSANSQLHLHTGIGNITQEFHLSTETWLLLSTLSLKFSWVFECGNISLWKNFSVFLEGIHPTFIEYLL